MKLSTEQLHSIERFLDSRELTQIDLRNEVIDHMANGIELAMKEKGSSFEKAFNHEIEKWKPELYNYSSLWLGIAWSGPKIMMKKCVKKTKQFYAWSLLCTFFVIAITFLVSTFLEFQEHAMFINNGIGLAYLAIMCAMIYGHWKIKSSGFKTSYSYLYKIHTIGTGLSYIFVNPFFMDFIWLFELGQWKWPMFGLHIAYLSFSYGFWLLYKSHFEAKKYTVV